MAVPLAEIIEVEALLSVIAASFVAGIGLTIGFSILIVTATRAWELRREGSVVGAAALGLVSAVAALACVALVAFGIYLMASK